MGKILNPHFVGSENSFVDSLELYFLNESYITRREINIGNGIADLVLAKVNKINLKKRLNHNQNKPLLNEHYFQTLKYIPDIEYKKRPVGISELENKTHLTKNFLKYTVIKNLESSGYITNVGGQKYLKINGWLPIADEVIAIEAKLKDWKRGFIQANRYQVCADKVYLALPKEISHLPDQNLFRKFGIGLITFDVNQKKLEVLVKPREKKINKLNDKRNYVSEFFLNQNKPSFLTD